LVGVSLDGPAPLHDAYRRDKGGGPTHARVMKGIEILKQHRVEFNLLCCVHAANAGHPLEVYRFLRDDVGAQFIQFIPIVERERQARDPQDKRAARRSMTGKQYGAFMAAIFDEWVRRDVGQVFVQLFDVCLGVWLGRPASLCVNAETCGLGLALEHNGDLYSCDHFVGPRFLLGNIREDDLLRLVSSRQQVDFGQAKKQTLPRYCRECAVRFICNGGCPKDRTGRTPEGEPGLNYLCAGYRAFFSHVDEPMKTMAMLIRAGRPPSDIMEVLARQAPPEALAPAKSRRGQKRPHLRSSSETENPPHA
jgi:uncharacterized protein